MKLLSLKKNWAVFIFIVLQCVGNINAQQEFDRLSMSCEALKDQILSNNLKETIDDKEFVVDLFNHYPGSCTIAKSGGKKSGNDDEILRDSLRSFNKLLGLNTYVLYTTPEEDYTKPQLASQIFECIKSSNYGDSIDLFIMIDLALKPDPDINFLTYNPVTIIASEEYKHYQDELDLIAEVGEMTADNREFKIYAKNWVLEGIKNIMNRPWAVLNNAVMDAMAAANGELTFQPNTHAKVLPERDYADFSFGYDEAAYTANSYITWPQGKYGEAFLLDLVNYDYDYDLCNNVCRVSFPAKNDADVGGELSFSFSDAASLRAFFNKSGTDGFAKFSEYLAYETSTGGTYYFNFIDIDTYDNVTAKPKITNFLHFIEVEDIQNRELFNNINEIVALFDLYTDADIVEDLTKRDRDVINKLLLAPGTDSEARTLLSYFANPNISPVPVLYKYMYNFIFNDGFNEFGENLLDLYYKEENRGIRLQKAQQTDKTQRFFWVDNDAKFIFKEHVNENTGKVTITHKAFVSDVSGSTVAPGYTYYFEEISSCLLDPFQTILLEIPGNSTHFANTGLAGKIIPIPAIYYAFALGENTRTKTIEKLILIAQAIPIAFTAAEIVAAGTIATVAWGVLELGFDITDMYAESICTANSTADEKAFCEKWKLISTIGNVVFIGKDLGMEQIQELIAVSKTWRKISPPKNIDEIDNVVGIIEGEAKTWLSTRHADKFNGISINELSTELSYAVSNALGTKATSAIVEKLKNIKNDNLLDDLIADLGKTDPKYFGSRLGAIDEHVIESWHALKKAGVSEAQRLDYDNVVKHVKKYMEANPTKSIDEIANAIQASGLDNWLDDAIRGIGTLRNGTLSFANDELENIIAGGKQAFPDHIEKISEVELNGYKFVYAKEQEVSFYKTDAGSQASVPGLCFAAGTPVKNTIHQTTPIEKLHVGDSVLCYDHNFKEVLRSKVTRLFKRTTDTLVRLIVGSTLFLTTPGHPFYANGQYIPASQLRPGDKIEYLQAFATPNCSRAFATRASHTLATNASYANAQPCHALQTRARGQTHASACIVTHISTFDTTATVHNFEVERYHNYFIGQQGLLVHNECNFDNITSKLPKTDAAQAKLQKYFDFTMENLSEAQRTALNLKISKLADGPAIERFLDDFVDDVDKLKWFAENPERVVAWEVVNMHSNIRKTKADLDKITSILSSEISPNLIKAGFSKDMLKKLFETIQIDGSNYNIISVEDLLTVIKKAEDFANTGSLKKFRQGLETTNQGALKGELFRANEIHKILDDVETVEFTLPDVSGNYPGGRYMDIVTKSGNPHKYIETKYYATLLDNANDRITLYVKQLDKDLSTIFKKINEGVNPDIAFALYVHKFRASSGITSSAVLKQQLKDIFTDAQYLNLKIPLTIQDNITINDVKTLINDQLGRLYLSNKSDYSDIIEFIEDSDFFEFITN